MKREAVDVIFELHKVHIVIRVVGNTVKLKLYFSSVLLLLAKLPKCLRNKEECIILKAMDLLCNLKSTFV